MKFSELDATQWASLQLYLDTAVVPVTGLTGLELPFEVTAQLEKLRDLLDLVEEPFKGRIVSYPAIQYTNVGTIALLEQVSANLKQSGFRFVVVVTALPIHDVQTQLPSVDVVISTTADGNIPTATQVSEQIRTLWLPTKV